MDNTTYFKELETRLVAIKELRGQCPSFAKGIIGQMLFKEDLFSVQR